MSILFAVCLRNLQCGAQVLARSCLDDGPQHRGLRLLLKICKTHGIIPSSYILRRELIHVGRGYCKGGFAVVSNGEYSGRPVAIKDLETDKGSRDATFKVPSINLAHYCCSDFNQWLCREIIIWKHLSHKNILPLLGVFVSADSRCFRILTEWMSNGNVIRYAKLYPKENRLRLVSLLVVFPRFFLLFIDNLQLSEVAAGVVYLHELKIVHGDLKGVSLMFLMGRYHADGRDRQMSSLTMQAPLVWLISVS